MFFLFKTIYFFIYCIGCFTQRIYCTELGKPLLPDFCLQACKKISFAGSEWRFCYTIMVHISCNVGMLSKLGRIWKVFRLNVAGKGEEFTRNIQGIYKEYAFAEITLQRWTIRAMKHQELLREPA